jgi:hypothetical protein
MLLLLMYLQKLIYFSPIVWAMQMRQQRETLGKHAMHFLAGYISMFSGQGPFQTGITRYVLLLDSSQAVHYMLLCQQTCSSDMAEKLMRP